MRQDLNGPAAPPNEINETSYRETASEAACRRLEDVMPPSGTGSAMVALMRCIQA
jgi:uncharacterized linocin/CFP29 family protein